MCQLLFSAAEEASKSLQSSASTHESKRLVINSLSHYYQREESTFKQLWEKSLEKSKDLTNPPEIPRQRKRSTRVEENSSTSHLFNSAYEFYRQKYYEVIDVIQAALNERFKDIAGSNILDAMEKLLVDVSNKEIILEDSQIEWLSMYVEINIPRLQIQVKLFCGFIAGCAAKHMPGLKFITKLQTLLSEEQQIMTDKLKLV